MFSRWFGRFGRGGRRRRFLWGNGSAWANPILVCAMGGAVAWVPLGLGPAEGSTGAARGDDPPPAVVSCLALPSDADRASCFAALDVQGVGGAPLDVAACLGAPSDRQRTGCFAAMGGAGGTVPDDVAQCLAEPAGAGRGDCFAAMGNGRRSGALPERVARCLAQPAGRRRASCFAALHGHDRVIGHRVQRCLERPAGAQADGLPASGRPLGNTHAQRRAGWVSLPRAVG
jgi:hypothetical protein